MNRERQEVDLREVLDHWTVPPMPADLEERVMSQMQEQANVGVGSRALVVPRPDKSWSGPSTTLSVIAIAAAAAAVVLTIQRPQAEAPTAIAAPDATPIIALGAASTPQLRGHLVVDVTPPGATVELDGSAVRGPSPFLATDLTTGPHTLRVHAAGYVEWTRVIDLPATQLHLPIALVPAAQASAATAAAAAQLGTSLTVDDAATRRSSTDPRGSNTPQPRVSNSISRVKGTLEAGVIRSVARKHRSEVRSCYNAGDPSLRGHVVIQFTIGPTGSVPAAVVQESSVKDGNVGRCIAKAVKRWRFPVPDGGGNVVVTQRFILGTGE